MVMISTWEKSMEKRGENVVKLVGKRWKNIGSPWEKGGKQDGKTT